MTQQHTTESLSKLSADELVRALLALQRELESERDEYEEYKTSSREMEDLLEKEVEDARRGEKEKERQLHLATTELGRLQDRMESQKAEMLKIEEALRKEMRSCVEERDRLRVRVRDLEQRNDDLERAERNNQQVLTDLGEQLDAAMERTTLLENEIADRQLANEEMYRLREELKERPRLVVGPLRVEPSCDETTPEEPTPETSKKSLMGERNGAGDTHDDVHMDDIQHDISIDDVTGDTDAMDSSTGFSPSTPTATAAPPMQLAPAVPDGKGFASCVNRIVKDLMVKVDRLEGKLSSLRLQSPRN